MCGSIGNFLNFLESGNDYTLAGSNLVVKSSDESNVSMQSSYTGQATWLVLVAMIWGGTNPLMKKGGEGLQDVKHSNAIKQFLAELLFLVTNWKYLVPFLLNQSGSLLYYITLASADLSLAVPITNSLTFIFTSLSGKLLGEPIGNKETVFGMGLVLVGVTICVVSKLIT